MDSFYNHERVNEFEVVSDIKFEIRDGQPMLLIDITVSLWGALIYRLRDDRTTTTDLRDYLISYHQHDKERAVCHAEEDMGRLITKWLSGDYT